MNVSVAPGPGTPRRGTLQQTPPDYDGANVTERRSTVNLSAIERAQEARRRQINGHHRMSMAGPPPSAAAATGHDNNRVDAAQRKAAVQLTLISGSGSSSPSVPSSLSASDAMVAAGAGLPAREPATLAQPQAASERRPCCTR